MVPSVVAALAGGASNLVLQAPPGAGKTTLVPPALLPLTDREIWVLEPRRLAARLAARRIASQFGEPLGETVGYQVRFDHVGGPRTRLRLLTEGVLTRRILSDPQLKDAGIVILDEFHERHLDGDLALALLRRLQLTSRPDLCILVMSATLDAASISRHLDNCPIVTAEGRLFPLSVRYTPHSARPLEDQVSQAVNHLFADGLDGDVLVFLPGAAEIRRAARVLEKRPNLLVLPLHGDLSPEEQDRAVSPGPHRKIILSTNVAESSITIEGVTAVIDSGLARIAEDSPWTGLPTLRIARVSRSSALQRAGRAGRTAPGRVIRLYPEEDFLRRPEQDTAEILRRELSETLLTLRTLGIEDAAALPWFEPPPAAALQAAQELLARLGATGNTARRMAACPLPPRLAKLALESDRLGAGEDGCALAAILSAGERLPSDSSHHHGPSDLFLLLDGNWQPYTRQLIQNVKRSLRPRPQRGHDDAALQQAVLAAFPDRVARRRQGDQLLLASGGSAVLSSHSVVRDAHLLVAVDIEERKDKGLPQVRLASAIEPEWLLDLFPDRIREESSLDWNRTAERVEARSALLYENLIIEESRTGAVDSEAAALLLASRALEAGLHRFADPDEIDLFLARTEFASEHSTLPALGPDDVKAALTTLCHGLRSFKELETAARAGLLDALALRLPDGGLRLLNEIAPERLRLPSGRQARIRYSPHRPPSLASRLQDFFGMKESPRIARGKVPVVLELLAPNHRPVQTTNDLSGFWERLYPQVRKELSRRYPRHAWPENPLIQYKA